MDNGLPIIIANGSIWQIVQSLSTFGAVILAILISMSLVSWMVIFRKIRQFKAIRNDSISFMNYFHRAKRLDEVAGQAQSYRNAPMANIFKAGFHEMIPDVDLGCSPKKHIPFDSTDPPKVLTFQVAAVAPPIDFNR